MTESIPAFTPILIVTFRNNKDVGSCLHAVARIRAPAPPSVFLCENGGEAAFARLIESLTAPDGGCALDDSPPLVTGPRLARIVRLRTVSSDPERSIVIHAACATENLGYAGGINAWLQALAGLTAWSGAWVLNPDTEPEQGALEELIRFAERNGKGMVGSRLISPLRPTVVHCRGLAWNKLRASTISVDMFAPVTTRLPPAEQDRRLDAPSGASIYVTRACLRHIGEMDERYFLYFEDLDWGLRAKAACGIGYAHDSVVLHTGGTTIGTSTSRRNQSSLAVYLDFRNRILFVREHFPAWFFWTIFIELIDVGLYVLVGRRETIIAAAQGLSAGLAGKTGRPDDVLQAHLAVAGKQGHASAH